MKRIPEHKVPGHSVPEHSVPAHKDLQGGAEPGGPQVPSTLEAATGAPAAPQPTSVPGPPVNPPSQGVPTNPAQPRT
jgi:hypothetical protein